MMEQEGLISVIIPVYNTEKYLRRCLASIINNSYSSLEILCINDGSTDSSQVILDEFAKMDQRIKVIYQDNQGVAAARNAGLEIASGEYISFVDSDDWVSDDMFSTLYQYAKTNDADIMIGMFERIRGEQKDVGNSAKRDCQRISVDQYGASGYFGNNIWGRILKKSVFGELRFPLGIKMSEDKVYNLYIMTNYSDLRIWVTQRIVYYYFSRADSTMASFHANDFLEAGNWIKNQLDTFKDRHRAIISGYSLALTGRYYGKVLREERAYQYGKRLCRTYFIFLLKTGAISPGEAGKYLIATCFPSVYRWRLIYHDPTIKKHEKYLKAR